MKPNYRLRVLATASAFALNGLSFGIWAARIPAIKAQTGLDDAGLGFALLGASVGAVLTMTFGGWLGSRFGTHVMTPLALAGMAVMLPFMGGATSYLGLTLSLLIFGVSQGTMDVCMNANGVAVEHASSGHFMSRLHGSWSIGAFTGALISSWVASAAIGPFPEFTVEAAFLLAAAVVLRFAMLPDKHAESGGLRLPTGRIALLGALALAGLMAEGSASDWSGVYLQHSMAASEGTAALAVTSFTGCMAIARLAGDRLNTVLGPARLVSGGALLSAVGLSAALLVPAAPIAIVGFGMMGLGLAAVVPTVFRAAGSQPGIPASVGIAAVSTMGYAGGLIGPALIGSVAQAATLRVSLTIILVLLIVLAVSGRSALRTPAAGSTGAAGSAPGADGSATPTAADPRS